MGGVRIRGGREDCAIGVRSGNLDGAKWGSYATSVKILERGREKLLS